MVVTEDQLSLAIGKRGQNVRLAARLTGWDIDILTPTEFNNSLDVLEKALRGVEGVDSTVVDQIVAMGMVNVLDVEEVGSGPLTNELKLDEDLAQKIAVRCAEEAKRVAKAKAEAEAEAAKAKAEAETAAEEESSAEQVSEQPADDEKAEAQADETAAGEESSAEQVSEDAGGGDQQPAEDGPPASDGEPGKDQSESGSK